MAAQHAKEGNYSTRYRFNGKEQDQATGFYYYGARYYEPSLSRWLSTDPLAEKYQGFSPYNYTLNNPINLVDPDGRTVETDFINKSTGEHKHVDDKKEQIVLVENKNWKNVALYDKSYSVGTAKKFGTASLPLYFGDKPIKPNKYGMYRFPESGKGFARYTNLDGTNNGNNENYTIDGVHHTGDNYASLRTFKALYKTFVNFNDATGYTLHYGDISAYKPTYDLGHKTHFTGESVDIHYFGVEGKELHGNSAYKSASSLLNTFFIIASNNGFNSNYSYGNRAIFNRNNHHKIHKNHFHIGIK